MPTQPLKIPVQSDLRPAYYDDFQCLAAACRFTCCKGWNITFDKNDYLALKHQSGTPDLNERMDKALRRLKKGYNAGTWYGEFDVSEGHCPLCREDGLCCLQLEKGHDALPKVCQEFPRQEGFRYSGYFERSLSPACEAVLALLWDLPQGVDFVSDPLPKKQIRSVVYESPQSLRLHFQNIRSLCIDFLQDRRFPLNQRIFLIGVALRNLCDGDGDVDAWLSQAHALPDAAGELSLPEPTKKSLAMYLSYNISVLNSLVTRKDEFDGTPQELCAALGGQLRDGIVYYSTAKFLDARQRFNETFADHDYFMENIMVTIFFQRTLPDCENLEAVWKSYVNFCCLYSCYRFLAIMSCREGAPGDKDELFRLMVYASRNLIHSDLRQTTLRDELFQNDSATLAHMAILLSA